MIVVAFLLITVLIILVSVLLTNQTEHGKLIDKLRDDARRLADRRRDRSDSIDDKIRNIETKYLRIEDLNFLEKRIGLIEEPAKYKKGDKLWYETTEHDQPEPERTFIKIQILSVDRANYNHGLVYRYYHALDLVERDIENVLESKLHKTKPKD